MSSVNISYDIINELSAIFLWVGAWGILDQFTHLTIIEQYKKYFYVLLILIAVYIKI